MSLDAADKIKTTLTGLSFGGDYISCILIQSAILNPAKSPRKSSKSSDSKNVRNFLNHKLDLLSFHPFWINLLVLAVGENNL